MDEAKRYDLLWGGSDHEMERRDDGEWIRWEDVEPLLVAAKAQAFRMAAREALRRAHFTSNSLRGYALKWMSQWCLDQATAAEEGT